MLQVLNLLFIDYILTSIGLARSWATEGNTVIGFNAAAVLLKVLLVFILLSIIIMFRKDAFIVNAAFMGLIFLVAVYLIGIANNIAILMG